MYARYVPPPKPAHASKPTPEPTPVPGPVQATPIRQAPSPPPPSASNDASSVYTYARWVPTSKPKPAQDTVAQEQVENAVADVSETPSRSTKKRKREEADDGKVQPAPVHEQPDKKKKTKRDKQKRGADEDGAEDTSLHGTSIVEPDGTPVKSSKAKKDKKGKKDDIEEAHPNGDDTQAPGAETKESKRKTRKNPNHADEHAVPPEGGMDIDSPPQSPHQDAQPEAGKQQPKRQKKSKQTRDTDAVEEDDSAVDSRHKAILDKKSKSLQLASAIPAETESGADEAPAEPEPTHALGPLPQPEPILPDTSAPTYSTLPSWLSSPISVSQSTRAPFSSLGVPDAVANFLSTKGYPDAFAVQTAVIPLLTPSSKAHPSDVLVAAATGSGKTLAYALPVVRDISQSLVTRLRVLVVLPTRELATQAKEVFELCAAAWAEERGHRRVKMAVSIGSQMLKQEQDALVDRFMWYDPAARNRPLSAEHGSDDDLVASDGSDMDDLLPEHVWEYGSKVDVLICTPGRLVEHMEHTPGFSLDHVRWLVVDEADKLLAESYQGWINAVMPTLKSDGLLHARAFSGCNAVGVRKVLLSATLTRDIGLLGPLQLRRPKLAVLEGEGAHAEHSLPEGLIEMAVRVKDAALKPLYLVDLLEGDHLSPVAADAVPAVEEEDSDATSSSGSDSDSDSDSDSSEDSITATPSSACAKPSTAPTVLVFTKSNESTLRLARLLSLLLPSLAIGIQALTSGTPTATRRRILRAFARRQTRIVIASDLVARGIDIASLDHVVNYDVPASVAAYVHRVGRTARAGRQGSAWTLVEDGESGWFWGKIGKGTVVRRTAPMKRVKVGGEEGGALFGEERVRRYEEVLAQVGVEAQEGRKRERK